MVLSLCSDCALTLLGGGGALRGVGQGGEARQRGEEGALRRRVLRSLARRLARWSAATRRVGAAPVGRPRRNRRRKVLKPDC